MKNYKQLIKELPSKKVVFAFGRFNPPTTGHELLVKMVKKIASTQGADHVIYASKTQDSKKNPLSVDKKVHYLNLMFHGTNFIAANAEVRTFVEAAKQLNKKYKNIVMVAGSDRVDEFNKILNKYNGSEFQFDTIQVISAGERDPDADDASGMSGTKMRSLASKGDFNGFKKGLPSAIREMDARRLMNDIRLGMGLEVLKEQVKFTVDELREQYFKGEIYQIGQFVESNDKRYEILDRGSNYLVLVDSNGNTSRKWIQDVALSNNQIKEDIQSGPAPEQITFKGYTTKNFSTSTDATKAFQNTIARASEKDPVAILNALKATDAYHGLNDRHIAGETLTADEIQEWKSAHEKSKESLERIGEFNHHEDYWHMHGHELEGLLTNFQETGKGELQDSAENEGTMIPEELTDKTIRPTDKIKVARIIATMLGVDKVENTSNPELLVNSALRRIKSKALNAEGYAVLQKMLALASEVGIKYDTGLMPAKLKEEGPTVVAINKKKTNNIAGDIASPEDVNRINKPGHSLAASSETNRKQKIKHHLGEAKSKLTALDKWRAAADSRLKKQEDAEKEYHAKKADFENEFKKWQKEVHGDKLKEAKVEGHWGFVGSDPDYQPTRKYGKASPEAAARIKAKLAKEKPADGSIYKKQTNSDRAAYVKNQLKSLKHIGEESLDELSTDMLSRYKKKAGADASAADKEGDTKRADKRFSGIIKATKKQFANDVKKEEVELEDLGFELDEAADKMQQMRDALRRHEQKAIEANRAGDDEKTKVHQAYMNKIKDKMAKHVRNEEVEVCPTCGMNPCACDHVEMNDKNLEDQLIAELDLTDEQIEHIIDATQEDEFIEVYEDDELAVVDDETGEEIEDEPVNEQALMEVLSRAERIRARVRFAKTKSKRERRAMIAARTHASTKVVNKRARRLAIKLMKKRLLRGRDASKLGVGEKERIERVLQKRKDVISRVAMKLAPRVRAIEKARLSHSKFTKGSPNVAF